MRRDTAISGLALALEGKAPGDGAGMLLLLELQRRADAHGAGKRLRKKTIGVNRRRSRARGEQGARKGRRGRTWVAGIVDERRRLQRRTASDFASLAAQFGEEARGNGCGESRLYSRRNGRVIHGFNRPNSGEGFMGRTKRGRTG